MNIGAVISGSLVFIIAYLEQIPLIDWIFGNVVGIVAITAATVSLIILWRTIEQKRTVLLRILAGFQVTMILLAITWEHFPNIIMLKNGNYLSLIENAGHEKAIASLAYALLIGSLFILPALYYLIYSFQKKGK